MRTGICTGHSLPAFHSGMDLKIFVCLSCGTEELSHYIHSISMGIFKCPDGYRPRDRTVVYCKLVHLSVFDLAMTDTHRAFLDGTGLTGTAMFPFISSGISIVAFRVRIRVRLRLGLGLGLGRGLGSGLERAKTHYSCDRVKPVLGSARVRARARVGVGVRARVRIWVRVGPGKAGKA